MNRLDLFHAHLGGIDTLARSLLVAADMLERRTLEANREARYAGWGGELGKGILDGSVSIEELERRVASGAIDPAPVSGSQELLEELVNRRIWQVDRDR